MSFIAISVGTAVTGIIGGTVVSALGASAQAQATASSARYNAAVQINNAGAEAQQSKFDAQQIADKTRRQVSMQRAAMASSGFDANSGTFTDVTSDTKRLGELNRLTRIYQGRLGINQSMSQSQLDQMQASAAGVAGTFSIIGDAMSGATALGGMASNPAFH